MLGAGEEDSQVAEAGCKQVSDSKGHGKRDSVAGAALLLCLICGINQRTKTQWCFVPLLAAEMSELQNATPNNRAQEP